jgi:NAD(P)-dependent dehydrogenase (short-subunit alcohol dehydrogenase family)
MAQGQHVGKLVVVGETPSPRGFPIRAQGWYLITGGLGGVGLALAAWLVEQGARHLVLASRRPPDAAQQAQIAQLEQAGASVTALELDVSDRNAVSGALAGLPLRGVIHAAGIIDDALAGAQVWERVCQVLAPKVAGLWELAL